MAQKAPIVNLADLPLEAFGKGEHFAAMLGSVGDTLNTRQIGCTLVVLEPGKRGWPYHLHYAQEELFVVLEGEGTLRYDGDELPIRAGDVILTPPGPDTAHQIVNTSDRELRYLAFSGKQVPEVAYYPDSDKYGVYAGDPEDRVFIAKREDAVDYWHDEPIDQPPLSSPGSEG